MWGRKTSITQLKEWFTTKLIILQTFPLPFPCTMMVFTALKYQRVYCNPLHYC